MRFCPTDLKNSELWGSMGKIQYSTEKELAVSRKGYISIVIQKRDEE